MAERVVKQEQRAIKVSIAGALFMSLLGIYFALATQSEAILLDGVFSGIGFIMAIATLKVAALVTRPDDEHFHYGYAHFGPLINVLKSLLMVILCGFALLSAVTALLADGRPMQIGSAVVYGAISTVGCVAFALYLKRAAKMTGSLLVSVDSQSWIIDALMSAAVLLSFMAGYLIQGTAMDSYLNYLDPALVALLCLLSLPLPLKILVGNGREVLLMAPAKELQEEVKDRVGRALGSMDIADYRLRMLKMGNTINILLHLKLGEGFELQSIEQLDEIRNTVKKSLDIMDARVVSDLVFVNDMDLADE